MQDRFDISFHLRHVADLDVTHHTIVGNLEAFLRASASIDLFFVVILVFNPFVNINEKITNYRYFSVIKFSYENHSEKVI